MWDVHCRRPPEGSKGEICVVCDRIWYYECRDYREKNSSSISKTNSMNQKGKSDLLEGLRDSIAGGVCDNTLLSVPPVRQ